MRGLKVAGILAAALALLLILTAVWIHSVASRRHAGMERAVQELLQEVKARDGSRPPRGEPLKGSAWDDYNNAFADQKSDKDSTSVLSEFISRGAKADPAKAAAAVSAHLAALDLLRQGVRRESGAYPYRWEDGFAMQIPGLLDSQKLGNLAAARARMLHEAGKSAEAIGPLLDSCQFARDMGYNSILISHMISLAVYGIALEELAGILASGKLTREELLDLDRALEGVERRLPRIAHSLVNEALALGWGTLPGGAAIAFNNGPPAALLAWRYGFSERIMTADAFEQALSLLRRMGEAEGKPWAEAQKMNDELTKEIGRSKNPIVQITVPGLMGAERASREKKAMIRILRTAARWRATGEIAGLDDPFGAKLLHAEKDGKLKVWSLGKDGGDAGGVGIFRTAPDGKDIVLEVSR